MSDNVQDFDYAINKMFNSDGTRKEYNRDEDAFNLSTNRPIVRNSRTKKRKPKGISDLAKKAIVLVAIGIGITVGVHELHEAMEVGENAMEIKNELASVVRDNTQTDGYNTEEQRPYWWYNRGDVASDVLNKNKEYDIDTRIYGCFRSLNEYNKTEHMDELFSKMSRLIGDNPGAYTEDEIKSALHSSFDEYLESKNISLEDYQKLMEKVIKAYAKEDVNQEEINSLLTTLNGDTTRAGGSR